MRCNGSRFPSGNPTRNEKYLACVAAGKWILHKSYFEACRRENSFVDVSLTMLIIMLWLQYVHPSLTAECNSLDNKHQSGINQRVVYVNL